MKVIPKTAKVGVKHQSINQSLLLSLSRSTNKHGCHMQFLFLIGRFLKLDAILISDWPIFKNLLL